MDNGAITETIAKVGDIASPEKHVGIEAKHVGIEHPATKESDTAVTSDQKNHLRGELTNGKRYQTPRRCKSSNVLRRGHSSRHCKSDTRIQRL